MINKIFKAIVITVAMLTTTIFTGFTTETVSACTISFIEYDLDNDGKLTEADLESLTKEVVDGSSDFNVTDMVKLKKLLMETEADEAIISVDSENPSEQDIQIVRNALFNSELTSIDYNEGKFILNDLFGTTIMQIPEATDEPIYDEFVANATLSDGKTVEVGITNGKIRVFRQFLCKPAVGYLIDSNFEVTEEHTELLKEIFENAELKDFVFSEEKLYFENDEAEIWIKFNRNETGTNRTSILAMATVGEVTVQLMTDGTVYTLGAVA